MGFAGGVQCAEWGRLRGGWDLRPCLPAHVHVSAPPCVNAESETSNLDPPARGVALSGPFLMRRAWLLFGAAACAAVEHEMCESWAESGECESNPAFMKRECTSSCANAAKYKTQMQKECEGYALAGECSRNPAFMLSTCRKECDKWEASKGGAVSNGQRRSTARPRAQPTTPTLALSR